MDLDRVRTMCNNAEALLRGQQGEMGSLKNHLDALLSETEVVKRRIEAVNNNMLATRASISSFKLALGEEPLESALPNGIIPQVPQVP